MLYRLRWVFIFFMGVFLISCEPTKAPKGSPLIEFLSIEEFQFDASKDTFLVAEKGSVLKIPANTFMDTENKLYQGMVKLEFLEVFELEDMVLGGLSTTTIDGELLESGGMFYLKARGAGQDLKINPKAKFTIGLAVDSLKKGAQFFYANRANASEELKWLTANNVNAGTKNNDLLSGGMLLLSDCSACHNKNLVEDMTAPALAWVTKRWKRREDLLAFTRNTEKEANSGKNLRASFMVNWAASAMVPYEHLSDKELNALYNYIDEMCRFRQIDSTNQDTLSDAYYTYYRDSFMTRNAYLDSLNRAANFLYVVDNIGIEYAWVNIDRFFDSDLPKQKDLKVELDFDVETISQNVRIVFPKRKTITNAYPSQKAGEKYYSFTETYNKPSTPFPIGEEAYLVATLYGKEQIYFGVKAIRIGDHDIEKLAVQPMSGEAIREKIQQIFKKWKN